jgi:hypothetical protein
VVRRGFSQRCAVAALLLAAGGCALRAQLPASADLGGLTAKQWASDAAQNEVKALNYGRSYLRYREHTVDAKGDHVRDVIESKDGSVARLILKEGRPLTQEEDAGEHDRLQAMIDSPSAFAKHVKGETNGRKMGSDLIRLTPDAMLFDFTPGQPQRAGHTGEPEIVLDYKPDPAWKPPTTASEALTGIQGRMWIDPRTHVLTKIEGEVCRGVNFGLFLVHIFPGGHLTVEQARVSDQRTIFTRFVEHVNVRVLFKQMKEDSDIEASDFTAVPEMSYQDAVKMLLATPLPSH